MSSLLAIQNLNLQHPYIIELLQTYSKLSKKKTIKLAWVPSHAGIPGNKKEDKMAKEALYYKSLQVKVPYTVLKQGINKLVNDHWQGSRPSCPNNKFSEIIPTIKPSPQHKIRRQDINLTRFKIAQFYFSYFFFKFTKKAKHYF
jgi:hypothetical protein